MSKIWACMICYDLRRESFNAHWAASPTQAPANLAYRGGSAKRQCHPSCTPSHKCHVGSPALSMFHFKCSVSNSDHSQAIDRHIPCPFDRLWQSNDIGCCTCASLVAFPSRFHLTCQGGRQEQREEHTGLYICAPTPAPASSPDSISMVESAHRPCHHEIITWLMLAWFMTDF